MLVDSLWGLWASTLITAALTHNFHIAKALLADRIPDDARPAALGRLGTVAGLGLIVGSSLSQVAPNSAPFPI